MDLKAVEEKSAYDEDKNKEIPLVKTCSGCYTTKTPLWRGGPHGPKSLCNACGIKYNKKRRQMLGLGSKSNSNYSIKKKKRSNLKRSSQVNITQRTLKLRLGIDLVRQGSGKQLMTSNLREEEIAAILLMALSCEAATVCA